jgi:hypothetical protein
MDQRSPGRALVLSSKLYYLPTRSISGRTGLQKVNPKFKLPKVDLMGMVALMIPHVIRGIAMREKFLIAALSFVLAFASKPAEAVIYNISASLDFPLPSSITGSVTMDDMIGPASISDVNIHATLPLSSGPFNFNFNQVINPTSTWPVGYLWFGAQGYGAGDTHFFMFIKYDNESNDGSYLIGTGFNGHQSEISVIGVNNWHPIVGRMTPAVPETSTWAMMIFGFAAVGFVAYRRRRFAA